MTLFYHPENQPLRFWEIKAVKAGERALVYKKDEKKPYGLHRISAEVEGLEMAGIVILTQGWVDPKNDQFTDRSDMDPSGFTTTHYEIPTNKPIIFGGRQKGDIPVIAAARWMLIVDIFKKRGWE